jgi:nitroreductase
MNRTAENLRTRYRRWRATAKLWRSAWKNHSYDCRTFLSASATQRTDFTEDELDGRLMAMAHVIEKGLSFRHTKPLFGQDMVEQLCKHSYLYRQSRFSLERLGYRNAVGCLVAYQKLFSDQQVPVLSLIDRFCLDTDATSACGGASEIIRENILARSNSPFREFALTRHSIRDFSDEAVDPKLIEDAIGTALKTPSACNRQPWEVYQIDNPKKREEVLRLQPGNRGFGHRIPVLLAVTCNLSPYFGLQERHLPFVDGGMFAMSLIFALHHNRLASCSLNWAVDSDTDKALKKILPELQSNVVILLIAVGHYPDSLKVACSPRRNVRDILHVVR